MKKIILILFCLLGIFNLTAQTTITIGTASIVNGPNDSSPINVFYRSHHCQIIYTPAEINGAGWLTAGIISKIGFNIFGTTSEALPNFSIKFKNTSSTSTNTYDPTGLNPVYSSASYFPAAGGFELLTLDNNFIWDGTSNLLVDVCFDQISAYTSTGQVYLYPYTNTGSDYAFERSDSNPVCNIATNSGNGGFNYTHKPQVQFELTALPPCVGLPSAGNAVSTSTNICANNPFSISLINNAIESGLEYQWQSSPDGISWTNLGSVQFNSLMNFSTLPATTYYQCITTCTASASSATSTPVMVALNPMINCYCTINVANNNNVDCTQDKIVDFSIANVVSQTTNCDAFGYSDSTASNFTSINLTAGLNYTLSVNTLLSGFTGDGKVGAWIDYNQNAIFDSNEFYSLGYGASGTYSNTLMVPITVNTGSVRMRIMLDAYYTNGSTVLNPCTNNAGALGQVLDYKVNLTAAPPCSAAPNAGDATSSNYNVCIGEAYNLNLINNDVVSGLTYQWQSSPNGTVWTNLGSAQNTIPFSVASQSTTTHYRCITTCTASSMTGTSTAIAVNQNAAVNCLCTPENMNCSSAQITNIIFETLNDAPVCNGINGYTDSSTLTPIPLNANQSYTISLDVNSQSGTGYVGLWIDLNQNGIFDSNEYTNAGTIGIGNLTPTINIPFTALGGTTKMRIKLESSWGYPLVLNPCTNTYSDGQVIDYSIIITPVPPCTGAPNAGDATSTSSSICENIPFTLNLANNDIVGNMTYQWQSSTDNIAWSNLGSSQAYVPYSILSQSVTSYYRCLTTCTTSALTSTSTVWTMTQNPVTACYCIPEPSDCSGGDVINHVIFATITNTSSCGTDGYSDYTGTVASATVSAGQTYTLTTILGSMFGQHVYVWIDYNQNGIFDSSEYNDLGSNSGNDTIQNTVNISVNALAGNTRMRVRNYYSSSPLFSGDACISPTGGLKSLMPSLGYGETEDYLVTILPPDCSIINFPPTVSVSGTLDICPGSSTTLDLTNPLPVATGITYQWKSYNGTIYVNEGTASSSSSLIASPSSNTPYYCEILCNGTPVRNTDTVLVKVKTITTSPTTMSVSCNGLCNGSASMNAFSSGATLSYMWMPTGGTSDASSALCAGLYTVTITNPTGCVVTETVSITEPTILAATLSQTNISCYGLTDGIATATVTGGTSPLNFSWLPTGGTAFTANNLSAGNYTFNVIDGNGCTLNQTITITSPGIFSASINANNSSICEQLEDTISSTIIGGTAPYSYNWIELPSTTVSTNPNYEYVTSVGTHSYNLSVTDINGCIANSNIVSVLVNPSSNFSGNVTTFGSVPVAGRVVLFKYLPFYTKFDSVAGQNIGVAGDFLFTSFTAGTYIIKAIPTATNMQIAYGAALGDTAVAWKDANQINHGCAINDVQDIFVKPLTVLTNTTGISGSLSGGVYGGPSYGQRFGDFGAKPTVPGTPIGGIIVKGGKNPGGQMFVQTVTDTAGKYTLTGLPPNGSGESYFILVDIPGLDTNSTYHRVINISNNNFQGLDFLVDSAKINPVPENVISVNDISAIENEIKVFPNPASNNVSIQYNLKASSLVKIELFDMLGKSVKVLLPEIEQSMEMHKNSWQINDVTAGLYFIKMTINGMESTIKLSVTH